MILDIAGSVAVRICIHVKLSIEETRGLNTRSGRLLRVFLNT